MNEEEYSYAVKNNIPQLVNAICERLMTKRPDDPYESIIRFLRAKQCGGFVGGSALVGTSVGSGWIRVFTDDGSLIGSVDRIPLNSEGEIQLLASCSNERTIFLASVVEGGSLRSPNTVVRSFSFGGDLHSTQSFDFPISCISVDQVQNCLWVVFKNGSGCILKCGNMSRVREINLPPVLAMQIISEQAKERMQSTLWLLTSKTIEKRDAESLQVEFTINLPESMLRPSTFVISGEHIWCASTNNDGSSNYVGVFERSTGKVCPYIIPPQGSIIVPDPSRSGTWHIPLHSSASILSFVNEKGNRLISTDMYVWRKANICVDKATGFLWLYKDGGISGSCCRLLLYDPISQRTVTEQLVPEVEGSTTLLVPL